MNLGDTFPPPLMWPLARILEVRLGASRVGVGIAAACYRTESAKSPKAPGRVLGRVPGKWGLLGAMQRAAAFYGKQRNGAAPSLPPRSPLFPGTLPSTLPGTFGDLGVFSPVAGGGDS